MSSSKSRKVKSIFNIKIILICIAFFILGYYLLNHVSVMEKPFLGNTFHIILGCVLMSVSILVFVITIKKEFFPKKRKKTSHIFLDDQKETKS
jgi:Zn-dependent membrane protease YugP